MDNEFESLAQTVRENIKPVFGFANRAGISADITGAQNPMPKEVPEIGHPFAVIGHGTSIVSLKNIIDEWRERPERRSGESVADDLPSFIALTKRFSDPDSAIFARGRIDENTITAKMTAILDYHPEMEECEPDNARFCKHRVVYNFPVSKDFKAWIAVNRVPMSQSDFAAFIEDRIGDVSAADNYTLPDFDALKPKFAAPTDIVKLSRGLEVKVKETVKNTYRLSSGETAIVFTNELNDAAGDPLKLPEFFLICVPIFEGGVAYRIPVRLRFRVKDGQTKWWFDLYRVDRAFDEAFNESCTTAGNQTGLPVYLGNPASA